MAQQKTFAERFLEHLDKIDRSDIESFVLRTVKERDFVARILETLIEGVVVVDAQFRLTMVNTAARRILHWPRQRRIIGEALLDLLPPGPLRELTEQFMRDPRPVQDQEMTLRPRARKVYNVHLLPIAETGQDDSVDAAALILQDLTSTVDKQARSAQADKISSLVTLTTGVAHQIKNPLNSLSIHTQLLERAVREFCRRFPAEETDKTAGRILRSCEAIGEEVERLRLCVDDFIEAARPRRPSLKWDNLNAVVESVIRMEDLECQALGIQVETSLDPDLPMLLIDEKQMQHALRNLLRNAVEAIETAEQPADRRRIAVRTSVVEEETVNLVVSDTGCGIAESEMPKVFEPYYTTKFGGSGLGLMAVGRIIREHKGQITVHSTEGEGTTFTIKLPVLRPRIKLLESKT